MPATEAGGSEGSNECVSADRDEELSDVQVSDEEEHEEDEEAPTTEPGGSEGSNESVIADSHE